MHDRSRLPKWAQREIEVLEMRLREAREDAEKATAAAGLHRDDTRTYGHLTPVEPHDTVMFTLGSGDQVEVRVARDNGKLRIHGNSALAIQPRVTNSIDIDVVAMF